MGKKAEAEHRSGNRKGFEKWIVDLWIDRGALDMGPGHVERVWAELMCENGRTGAQWGDPPGLITSLTSGYHMYLAQLVIFLDRSPEALTSKSGYPGRSLSRNSQRSRGTWGHGDEMGQDGTKGTLPVCMYL